MTQPIPFLSRVRASVLCFADLDEAGPSFAMRDGAEGIYLCFYCLPKKGTTKKHVVTVKVFGDGTFEVPVSHRCTTRMDPKGYLAAMSRAAWIVTAFALEAK